MDTANHDATEREAGWFDDPAGRHAHRYWDGSAWTAQVANDGVASADERGLKKLTKEPKPSLAARAKSTSKGLAVRVKDTTDRAVELKREKTAQRNAALARRQWDQRRTDLRAQLERLEYEGSTNVPFVLQPSEVAFFLINAVALIESRQGASEYVGRSGGASVYVGYGVSLGGSKQRGKIVPGQEALAPIDHGTAVVTNTRVLYQGRMHTREWAYPELLSVMPQGPTVMLGVSSRAATSGLNLAGAMEQFMGWLEVALAHHRGDIEAARARVADELAQLEAHPPDAGT